MNEEKPKSIWTKSFRGRTAFVIWLAVLIFTLMLGCFIAALANYNGPMSDWLMDVGVIAGGCLAAILSFIYIILPLLRFFFWKHWQRTLFGLACFITLIALFYAEEDWRGKHDWNKFKHEQEAKGERFDWQSIVPPSVPDDENFAFSPVWIAEDKFNFLNQPQRVEAWYGDRIYDNDVAKMLPLLPVSTSTVVGTNIWKFHGPPDNSGTWAGGEFLDLKPFQAYYRDMGKTNPAAKIIIAPQPQTPAQDVLLALSKFDPVIEQLRRDSARPYSRFPLQYNSVLPSAILLPHLAAEKRIAQVLQLRAIAELQNGENEKAFADIKLMLRLVDASRNEPFLICHLVRIAILNLALQPIWEGSAKHQWSDAQLTELDSELAKLDFFADNKSVIRGERNLEIANIEFLRHPHGDLEFKRPRLYFLAPMLSLTQMLSNMSSDNDVKMNAFQIFILGIGPAGWFDQNELRLARFNTQWYLPVLDEETKVVLLAKIRAANDALRLEIRHRTPGNVLAAAFIVNWNNAVEKFVRAQSSTDLARVALVLERYRLANGNYPESLAALAPKFISEMPHDVIGGGPLKYRREANGQFVLYSIGWNERDDGGVVVFKKGTSPDVDISKGDWVWRYPQK